MWHWSNDAEISALLHRNYILKYIKIENCYFTIIFHKISFCVFWSNKYSLDEHKNLLKKKKIVLSQTFEGQCKYVDDIKNIHTTLNVLFF